MSTDPIKKSQNYKYPYLCRNFNINATLTAKAATSATIIEHQIPFNAKNIGKIITAQHSQINVLKTEIIAETNPLFNAVKNADA